jgi:hypothetical protein
MMLFGSSVHFLCLGLPGRDNSVIFWSGIFGEKNRIIENFDHWEKARFGGCPVSPKIIMSFVSLC